MMPRKMINDSCAFAPMHSLVLSPSSLLVYPLPPFPSDALLSPRAYRHARTASDMSMMSFGVESVDVSPTASAGVITVGGYRAASPLAVQTTAQAAAAAAATARQRRGSAFGIGPKSGLSPLASAVVARQAAQAASKKETR